MSATLQRPLKLAIYMADFHGGGVERVNLMLIEAFVARGLDVTVVVNQPEGDLRPLMPASAKLESLGSRGTIGALPGLAAYLLRDSPDVLLSSMGHNNIVALWARMLARLARLPARVGFGVGFGSNKVCDTRIVISQHNALSAEALGMHSWKYRMLPQLYRWFGGRADAIIGVSEGVSDDLSRTTGIARNRITTIHNPVIDRHFESALAQPATHRWLGDASLKVVVGIGRLVPQKDFGTLLNAFAQLARPGTRLLILGDGPERERLQHIAGELGIAARFEMPGFALNPLPTLRDSGVMALSSRYEGFGNVLVEALGAGVPVVSTRCDYGPEEILEDGRFGELVPVGNAPAMAAALARQLDDPHPARELRQQRARDFHVDIVSQRYLDLLVAPKNGARSSATSADGSTEAAAEREVFVYLPNLKMGGAEISLVRLAGGFAQRGVKVALVVHDTRNGKIDVPEGVELVVLGACRSLSALWSLVRLLRARRPRFMLTAFPHTNVMAVLARTLARVDCRLVISEHAPLSLQVAHMGGWRYRALPRIARWAYPRADAVVAVSQGVRDDLGTLMPGVEPHVIYNPVLPVDWAVRTEAEVEHPWLMDSELDVVLTVSRLSVEKDVPVVVRAFASIAQSRPTARLLIAGEGVEREAIERCIAELGLQDRAQLVGVVANPLAWMRRARLFVLASRFEGFGNVLVEALAAGTRVISTDCPVGPREVLQGGRFGALVPVGDVAAMAREMAAVLDSDPTAAGRALGREAAQQYTLDRACTDYMAVFAEIESRDMPEVASCR